MASLAAIISASALSQARTAAEQLSRELVERDSRKLRRAGPRCV